MITRLASTLLLLASIAGIAGATPLTASDGVAHKPRASRPTCATGKTCYWTKTDGELQSTTSGADFQLSARNGRIGVALTQPIIAVAYATANVYQAIYWVPPDVTSYTMVLAQSGSDGGNALYSATAYANMSTACGQPSLDRQALTTVDATASNVTYPATAHHVAMTVPTVHRDADGYVMCRWTSPVATLYADGAPPLNMGGGTWVKTSSADLTATSGFAAAVQTPFAVRLVYTTKAPRLVVIGDSIERGAARGTDNSLLYGLPALGPERGYSVSVIGFIGMFASTWAAFTDYQIHRQSGVYGATVYLALGTNDVFYSQTSSQIITSLETIIRDYRGYGCKRLILATIPPSSVFNGTQNSVRDAVNAWIRDAQFGLVDDIDDRDLLWRDPGTPTQLLAGYATSDNLHVTAAAFAVRNAAFPVLR